VDRSDVTEMSTGSYRQWRQHTETTEGYRGGAC